MREQAPQEETTVIECHGLKALSIVAAHEEGSEIQRLREKLSRTEAALNAVQKFSDNKERFYSYLVWLARHDPNDVLGGRAPIDHVLNCFTGNERDDMLKEIHLLFGPQVAHGQFHHGFNSGMLAAIRLYNGLATRDDEVTEDGNGSLVVEATAKEQRDMALASFPNHW